jgi:membrane protein
MTPAAIHRSPDAGAAATAMLRRLNSLGSLLWRAISLYQTHNVNRMAASVGFYGILSIAPLGVITVTVAGAIFGRSASEGLIVDRLRGTLGQQAASTLQSLLHSAYVSKASVPATVIAFLVLIFSATRLVGDVRGSLNSIWEVQGRGGGGFKGYLVGKGIDVIAVFVLAGLLLVTLLANTAVNAINRYFAERVPFSGTWLQISSILFSFIVATVVFTIVFRWLPNTDLGWMDVAFGGVLSAALFTLGNYVLGLYLGRSTPGSIFGAAGSFVVIMIWMYYSSIIVLFGVEVTRARWERRHGSKPGDLIPAGKQMSDA